MGKLKTEKLKKIRNKISKPMDKMKKTWVFKMTL